jgi:prepilin-type N-terminal cleavage/methylation domain-containing protein
LKNKSAFTIIELVFVIVVLGILASIAMGRMDRDLKQEVATTILSHIRLTQQLAMSDNKHRSNNDSNWQRAYWRIQFKNCLPTGTVKALYNVGSDDDLSGNDISKSESAVDHITGKYLYATCLESSLANDVSENIRIGKKYGVSSVNITGCSTIGGSTANQIAFDYLGRPHRGVTTYDGSSSFNKIVRTDCLVNVNLLIDQDNDGNLDSFTIVVKADTGHAFILGQENS